MCSAEFSLFAKSAEPLGFCSCCFNFGIRNAGQPVSYFSLFQVCGLERAIVNQSSIGTVSKATLGKLLRHGVERIWAFPSA